MRRHDNASPSPETARQWVHIGSGGFALLLRILTWPEAAMLAVVALAFNALMLPRLGGRRLYRPVDEARGFPLGILLYPTSVLLLILVFRSRLDIVAASWGVLAFGDGFATLVGRRVGSPKLPWNREKSVAGTLAFAAFGGAAGAALAWWMRPAIDPQPALAFTLAAPWVAAIAAALVETIPVRLDDNVSVPFAAAVVLWFVSLIDPTAWSTARAGVMATLPWALGVNLVTASVGYLAQTVSISGMIGGALIGVVVFAAGGPAAWALLFITFAVATITSRLGLRRKMRLGIAEERGGRRGAGNAFANTGVAAVAALAAVTTAHPDASMIAFVAALTSGGSDTVASEIGKAWGRRTFLVTTLRPVQPGTSGAMSLEGTAAGLTAAIGLCVIAVAFGLVPRHAVVPVVLGATAAALVESALGATVEGPGILNNDMLNFVNTATAVVVALWLA